MWSLLQLFPSQRIQEIADTEFFSAANLKNLFKRVLFVQSLQRFQDSLLPLSNSIVGMNSEEKNQNFSTMGY